MNENGPMNGAPKPPPNPLTLKVIGTLQNAAANAAQRGAVGVIVVMAYGPDNFDISTHGACPAALVCGATLAAQQCLQGMVAPAPPKAGGLLVPARG